jgi:hypothetical protein
MKRSLRATIVGCNEAPHCLCRWIKLPAGDLTLEARLIRLVGWRDSLGKRVRITIETLDADSADWDRLARPRTLQAALGDSGGQPEGDRGLEGLAGASGGSA